MQLILTNDEKCKFSAKTISKRRNMNNNEVYSMQDLKKSIIHKNLKMLITI